MLLNEDLISSNFVIRSTDPRQLVNAHLQCIAKSKLPILRENLESAVSPTTNMDLNDQLTAMGSDWSLLEECSVWAECNESSWTPTDLVRTSLF